MTFAELLKSISADAHLDISHAVNSGGCAIRFEHLVEVNFECHDNVVYLFSPVMSTTENLSGDFFSSLLQIHLFGVATQGCWFGFDANGQQVVLFSLLALPQMSPENAGKDIDIFIEQVTYWQENLPLIAT